ncbi:hypothetical protein L7H23_17575 [Sphingopyxis sp. BSN-002]|uniref:SecDF P1 head subdomain-containing protein n=1 Tax=Sphingopyxis sp. BSN-002 TaxID=2911495 RepID=UPI001EDA62B2|nr:hypothetical protein [Sphingopyxis sp. BSN-002]UKK84356.1 hypothetical protein L7H23_17575 [Sphingopyxis sp. BSN-002]
MNRLSGVTAIVASLALPTTASATTPAPAGIASAFADAQSAVEDAGACIARARAGQIEVLDQRLIELRRKVGGLWGRQAVAEREYGPRPRCRRSAIMLETARQRLDTLDRAFAAHSAPYNSGAWVGTMPLCGAGPVETRKAVEEYNGEEVLQITLGKAAAADLAALTAANVGHQLAVRVDGEIIMEPNINEPITGGSIQVMGSTPADIDRLAGLLARCTG